MRQKVAKKTIFFIGSFFNRADKNKKWRSGVSDGKLGFVVYIDKPFFSDLKDVMSEEW